MASKSCGKNSKREVCTGLSKGFWPNSWNNLFPCRNTCGKSSADFPCGHRRVNSEPASGGVGGVKLSSSFSKKTSTDIGPFKLPSKNRRDQRNCPLVKRTTSLFKNSPSSNNSTSHKKNSFLGRNTRKSENRSIIQGGELENQFTKSDFPPKRLGTNKRSENSSVAYGCLLRLYVACGADFGDADD